MDQHMTFRSFGIEQGVFLVDHRSIVEPYHAFYQNYGDIYTVRDVIKLTRFTVACWEKYQGSLFNDHKLMLISRCHIFGLNPEENAGPLTGYTRWDPQLPRIDTIMFVDYLIGELHKMKQDSQITLYIRQLRLIREKIA